MADLKAGTRGSALALAQTGMMVERLRGLGHQVDVVTIRTEGDRAQKDRSMMVGRGAFVKELERALLDGEVDLAVHSAKDMPTEPVPGTTIVALPAREDPRDALVSADGERIEDLPGGARVGTESPRRRAFLLLRRSDLEVAPIRGNVDSRLARLDAGEYDAIVVATAGLVRLGRAERIVQRLDPETMLPAVGQGALAIQMRADDPLAEAVRPLDDATTRAAVVAERAFLRAMGGGCKAPFAALAEIRGGRLSIDGAALQPDGRAILRERVDGAPEAAETLGERVAESLLSKGAAAFAPEDAG